MGGSPASPSEVLRTMTGVGGPKHLGGSATNMDLDVAGDYRRMQLSELEEWREKSYHNWKIYKERVKRWHDKRIKKKFTPGDMVLFLIPG